MQVFIDLQDRSMLTNDGELIIFRRTVVSFTITTFSRTWVHQVAGNPLSTAQSNDLLAY